MAINGLRFLTLSLMPISLDDILSNPELESNVTIDWVKIELAKQPYNQYLQGLLARKSNEYEHQAIPSVQSLIESIMADESMNTGGPYFIRDVELNFESTFAQASEDEIKEAKKNQITSAAISAGAIITGSIVSGANEAASLPEKTESNPISNTEQIEESGLLGFLNRLDGTIKRSQPNAAMDPMHREENYQPKPINKELGDDPNKIQKEHIGYDDEQVGAEDYPDIMDFNSDIVKKKKKVKVKAGKGLRWSSMTPSDYKIKTLDPFTKWINTIEGVEISPVEEIKKEKKKKKKKKSKHLDSLQDKPEIASEQLANLLVNQGHIEQAIAMYGRLSLKYPEKSSFFAAKIDSIKDKI